MIGRHRIDHRPRRQAVQAHVLGCIAGGARHLQRRSGGRHELVKLADGAICHSFD
jgi:hypothetical protein